MTILMSSDINRLHSNYWWNTIQMANTILLNSYIISTSTTFIFHRRDEFTALTKNFNYKKYINILFVLDMHVQKFYFK